MGDSIEGETLNEDASSGDDIENIFRKMRPPNRKKFDEEVKVLTKLIQDKESEIKSGNRPDELSRSQSMTKLSELRAEKDETVERRKKLNQELKNLGSTITQSTGALRRLEANLDYKSEGKIDEAIRKLDYQLKTQNFRLSEEKKIVNEIDSLKRSKRGLSQYLTQKKEVDEMRAKQKNLREDLGKLYTTLSTLKSQEEDLKKKTYSNKSKIDAEKKGLDELHKKKKQLVAEFKMYEKEYYTVRDEVRKKNQHEFYKKREEQKRAQVEATKKERAEYESQKEPYEDEKLLCNTLISYLQRFLVSDADTTEEQATLTSAPAPAITHQDGMYVLLKKPDVEVFSGISRKGKKGSKKKKMSMHKPVTHTPQIFAQFDSLNLSAPANISEVSNCIQKLQGKKKLYESFVKQPWFSEDQSVSSLSVSVSDLGADSLGDSLMSESGLSGSWSLQSPDPISTEEGDDPPFENPPLEIHRQTSKTESTGSTSESQTCDSIVEALSLRFNPAIDAEIAPAPVADDENSSPECDHLATKSVTQNCDISQSSTLSSALPKTIPTPSEKVPTALLDSQLGHDSNMKGIPSALPKSETFEVVECSADTLPLPSVTTSLSTTPSNRPTSNSTGITDLSSNLEQDCGKLSETPPVILDNTDLPGCQGDGNHDKSTNVHWLSSSDNGSVDYLIGPDSVSDRSGVVPDRPPDIVSIE